MKQTSKIKEIELKNAMGSILDNVPKAVRGGVDRILSELQNHRKLIGAEISQNMQYLTEQQKGKYAQNEEEKQYVDGQHDAKRGFDDRLDESMKSYIANVDNNNLMNLGKMTSDLLQNIDQRMDNNNKLRISQNEEKY